MKVGTSCIKLYPLGGDQVQVQVMFITACLWIDTYLFFYLCIKQHANIKLTLNEYKRVFTRIQFNYPLAAKGLFPILFFGGLFISPSLIEVHFTLGLTIKKKTQVLGKNS